MDSEWTVGEGGGSGLSEGHAIGHSSYIINLIPMVVHLPFAIWSGVQAGQARAEQGKASRGELIGGSRRAQVLKIK